MENQIHNISQVSDEENEILIADFTENEVREAVFKMEHNKAPGHMASQLNSIKYSGG
jgi:hypothetical protein